MTSTNETLVAPIKHASFVEALVAFQAEVGAVAKDTANPFFKSTYADLPAVVAAAQPYLTKHGLAITQEPHYLNVGDDKVVDTLRTTVLHTGNPADRHVSTMILHPVKNDPQAHGSAITYARRYAYMAVLGLVADEDDDGNAASGRSGGSGSKSSGAARNAKPAGATGPAAAALKAVKEAVRAAGATSKDASVYFAEKHGGDLFTSKDADALNDTAQYFATGHFATTLVQGELGGTVVE